MKRALALLLALALFLTLLPACRQESGSVSSEPSASALPEQTAPPPTPTPTPEPTPEPAEGMALVRDALLECCREELAGLESYSVTMYEDGEDFSRLVAEVYGIDPDLITDGVMVAGDGDVSDPLRFHVAVLRTNITASDFAEQITDTVWDTMENRRREYFMTWNEDLGTYYLPAENVEPYRNGPRFGSSMYRIGGHTEMSSTIFLFFRNCQNGEKVSKAFTNSVDQYCDWAVQSQGTAPTPAPAAPQPVEIGEGVSFIDVSGPEAKGEPDPDHPGRARYVQPNQEDMSLYDTSAILAAWEKGDPAGLTEYDRAIYDSAEDVLKSILTEGMDGFAKEAAIYEWVIQNVEYDWTHTDVLAETPRESYTPYGGLVDCKAVCLGYATTFQLLAELAGIECVTVVGAAAGADHAWNQVQLSGEWYCADVTWEIPYWEDGTMNGREWRYFNTTSDYMARTNHQWDYDNVPEAAAEDHGRP